MALNFGPRQPLAILAFFALIPCAHAGKVCFGEEEQIHFVVNVEAKDREGRALALSRKFTSQCALFPYAQRDDGYVLTIQEDSTKYYPLPPEEELRRLQSSGALPDPLPEWNAGILQLIFEAYFLWVFVAGCLAYALYQELSSRRRAEQK